MAFGCVDTIERNAGRMVNLAAMETNRVTLRMGTQNSSFGVRMSFSLLQQKAEKQRVGAAFPIPYRVLHT